MNPDPERIPVIIGVGQLNDRPADPRDGRDPVALATAACRIAAQDAAGGGDADAAADILAAVQYLGVVKQVSFPSLVDLAAPLAAALGIAPAFICQTAMPSGDSPVRLLNDAANLIGSGKISLALVGGAEALRTAAARVAAAEDGRRLDPVREAPHRTRTGYAAEHGLIAPTDVYPLYENAMRPSLGQSLDQAQAETGAIWSLFSQVAAANRHAWVRRSASAEEITCPSAANRPISFPYTKLQVANSSVNQGAAFLVASAAEARRRAIPESRWIYVGNGAAAREPDDLLARDRFDRSASMQAALAGALAVNGLSTGDLDAVELYSCFPCIVKLARREIDWPIDRPASQVGGLTFGGGPVGNYMSHAICAMAARLRESGGTGLLFGNGGLATSNHVLPLSASPLSAASFPRDYDVQQAAEALRQTVPPLDEGYIGPATVETWTVTYDRDHRPGGGAVIARTPEGARTLAAIAPEDAAVIALFTGGDGEAVGRAGKIVHRNGKRTWSLDLN